MGAIFRKYFAAKRNGPLLAAGVALLLLSAIICQPAHAVVWCHDYTVYALTGRDVDNTKPGTLRGLLKNLGYKRFSYTSARFSPGAMSHLKEGDVLIIGDSHSGVVNKRGTIDHFIQIEGRSGTHYDPGDDAFQKLVRRNNTLEQFLNRPIYRNMTLEVWRFYKQAELSADSADARSHMGCLTIFAITAEGRTLYKARVTASSGSTRKEGETDYYGSISFDLPAGTVSVTAQSPAEMQMKAVAKSVSIPPGACQRIYLVMKPEGEATGTEDYGRLTVRVMNEEGWFSGAKVAVSGMDGHNYPMHILAATGADGYAAIMDPLPPGRYRASATAPGHGADSEQITVSAGKEASLVLLLPYKLQPLSVGVLDKGTRKAIPGARVELEPGVTSITNVQGVAAFKGVPVGKRQGKVTAQGYPAAAFTVNIEDTTDYLTSTIVYLEAGKTPGRAGPSPATSDRERRALQDEVQRWVKILECLEEGKRKHPTSWLDCNGNYTMRDRDVEIAHYRNLIKGARTKLGQPPSASAAVSPSAPLPPDRIALTALNGAEAFGTGIGMNERRPSNGELMGSGTTLRTGRQSTASFRTPGETHVTLQQNTLVTVVQKPKERGPVWQVDLSAGIIDVVHREGAPGYDDVNVTSRDGSVTPFNTRYRVEAGPTGSLVVVFQGRVRLNGTQILRLDTAGKPSPVKSLDLPAGERAIMLKTSIANMDKPAAKNLLINSGFEQGLTRPWESGSFSKDGAVWFNSSGCRSAAVVDRQNVHSGTASLHLRNVSGRAPNIYGTMTQKIRVDRNRKYAISLWAKGENLASNGALNVAIDPTWRIRPLALPAGTFGWSRFSGTFNSQDRDLVEFRIIFEDTGDVWLDDLVVEELPENVRK